MSQVTKSEKRLAAIREQINRILRPKGGLTVALDHGVAGVPRGLEDVPQRVRDILEHRPDAVIVTAGMVRALGHEISGRGIDAIGALDTPIGESGKVVGSAEVGAIDQYAESGCVCVKVVFQLGWMGEAFGREITRITGSVTVAQRMGMPIMVEPVLVGGDCAPWRGREAPRVIDGCRIASELGADVLKIPMLDAAGVRSIVEMSYCPVTILGGEARPQVEFLAQVKESLRAGVLGVVVGRNVWQDRQEGEVIASLRQLLAAQ